ncbi:MAG: 50S ribosomal protein L17 [Limisphaerales bacterium]|jgi:large subunit ribosomal protein L17
MRHLKRTAKLGRKGQHRNAMLANLVCSLIKKRKVQTTLAKAKAARSIAEKMITLGKKNTQHARRLAASRLKTNARTYFRGKPSRKGEDVRKKWREEEDVVHILFDQLAPGYTDRNGGYTRILKLGQRRGDAAELAILEWVEGASGETPAEENED